MPFAPSPTDGSIPTNLVLLAAERAVTVTREEHHQDVLSGRTGQAVVELRPCMIASGEARGSGRARGRARRAARRRADPPDGAALPTDGRRPDGPGVPRGMRGVPSGGRPRNPGRAPVARRASERPASGRRADGPVPAPGSLRAGSDDHRPAERTAAAAHRRRRPPSRTRSRRAAEPGPAHTRAGAISPRALGSGRGDRGAAARIRPRQRHPGRPTGHPLATADRGRGHLLPDLSCRTPVTSRTPADESAEGDGDPGIGDNVQARAPDGPGRTEAWPTAEPNKSRPVATRITAAACRSRATWTVRAAGATARRT